MNNWIEITAEAFNKLWLNNDKCVKIERLEHATKHYYSVYGVVACEVNNFNGTTRQYFLKDVNA